MLATRHERLNALAKINSASTYLEIGVCHGLTFAEVDIPYKVAVDPSFRFEYQSKATDQVHFHQVTSDTFFSNHASQHGRFDLIYLDGLHTFDQTLRDFQNSLDFAHDNTIWLIDDTNPNGTLAANPNYFLVKVLRKLLWIKEEAWMGDVFKVVFAIHDFFSEFSYATFTGHGQTAIWKEPRTSITQTWNSTDQINKLTYSDFLKYRDSYLKIADSGQILKSIEQKFQSVSS